MSEGPVPKNWREAIPAISWGTLTFAAGFEGVASGVHGEWGPSVASFAVMIALLVGLMHGRQWISRLNPNWAMGAAVALVVAIGFSPLIGPTLWPFWPTGPSGSIATIPPNPLHPLEATWRLAQRLAKSPLRHNCDIVIVRLQTDYAERFSGDFKDVLDALGWEYREQLANNPLPRGLSLRSEEAGPSRDCANSLFDAFNGSGLVWTKQGSSGNLAVPLDFFSKESSDHACIDASRACVRVAVGNEPP